MTTPVVLTDVRGFSKNDTARIMEMICLRLPPMVKVRGEVALLV